MTEEENIPPKTYRTYICTDCVAKYEGKPKDGIHTHHYGLCDFCNKRGGITHTRNFEWGYMGRPI